MRLTIPHYYDFGEDRRLVGDDLVNQASWDALRTQTSGPFSLPPTRREWESAADRRPELRERARGVLAVAEPGSPRRIASYGVGGALVELWMRRLAPDLEIVMTDYAPTTIERLRELAGDDFEVASHDLLTQPPLGADLHLFHRIDTELTDAQWHGVMQRFAGVRVLVVATEIIDMRRVVAELRGRLRRGNASRAGWIRTRSAFEALWSETHHAQRVRVADLDGWVLEPRAR